MSLCRPRKLTFLDDSRYDRFSHASRTYSFTTTDQELRTCFEAYGTVETVRIMTDRDTGRPRGFGFVEMPNGSEAQAAIAGLNGTSLGGRPLTVNEARQREERGGPRRPRW